ncbi:type II secretion system protein GspG [Verrucomicrobiota bacterium sgz303538]
MNATRTEHTLSASGLSVWWSLFAVVALAAVVGVFAFLQLWRPNEAVPIVDLQINGFRGALLDYKKQFGTYPEGDSRTIFRALTGDNPLGKPFLAWSKENTSSEGVCLDPWGTPYIIYISGESVLIHSAGPNRQFETPNKKGADDCFGR